MDAYLELGLTHILDPNGLDHVLFLIVLVITYALSEWKSVLILATAFTIGHSVTLALAAMNIITVDSQTVEIFIAASIAITALLNIVQYKRYASDHNTSFTQSATHALSRYFLALLFGLIHGLGFSNFFKAILGKEYIFKPLLAFNVGVEIAQVIIVLVTLLFSFILSRYLLLSKKYLIIGVSSVVLILSISMIFERT